MINGGELNALAPSIKMMDASERSVRQVKRRKEESATKAKANNGVLSFFSTPKEKGKGRKILLAQQRSAILSQRRRRSEE